MSRISARSANYLVDAVEAELRAEGLPADTFAALQPDDLRLAKTASRSTLGFMTEMAFELAWIIADQGGLRRSDINALNQALRRVLWNRGDYVRPIELVNQRLNARASPLEARHKEQARERRQQRAIGGPQQRAPLLPSEHGQLMPQHEQLNVFGELAAPVRDQEPQHSREGEIGERKEHAPMLSSPAATGSKGQRSRPGRQRTVAKPGTIWYSRART